MQPVGVLASWQTIRILRLARVCAIMTLRARFIANEFGTLCIRYYVLIEFAAYISEPKFDPTSPRQIAFGQWLAARPELHRWIYQPILPPRPRRLTC